MLTALLLACANNDPFTVVEVSPFHTISHGSRDHVYLVNTPQVFESDGRQIEKIYVERKSFDGTKSRSLLSARVAEDIRQWLNKAGDTHSKGYRLDKVIHDRWLLTRASVWDKEMPEKVRMVVIDTETKKSFEFKGFTKEEARVTSETIMAVGDGWAVMNYEAPFDIKNRKPPTEPSRMFLMQDGRKTDIGFGRARGADLAGRIYASETVDTAGKATHDRDPAGKQIIKMYEKGQWTKLGEGNIRHVRGDGALLVTQKGGYEFMVQNGKWTKISQDWGLNMAPTFLADNGDMLLVGRTSGSSPMPAFDVSIVRNGKVIDVKSLLPEGSELERPEMAPDGSVLVSVRGEPVGKSYLIVPK